MTSAAREIAAEIAASAGLSLSNLRLRFDRVATRVLAQLSSAADRAAPEGVLVLLAMTAPIRLPAKTVSAVVEEMETLISHAVGAEMDALINGNSLRMKRVSIQPSKRLNFIGFIHNANENPARLLDLAEAWARGAALELKGPAP
jgi:hypothetical protein